MGRKVLSKPRAKKNLKKSERQILKEEIQIILREVREAVESNSSERNSSDADIFKRSVTHGTQPHIGDETQAFSLSLPNKRSLSGRPVANNHDKDAVSADKCYRCKHFLKIPQNLSSQTFVGKVSGSMEQYEIELSFVQAMVWLKSVTTRIPQLSDKQLHRIFNEQRSKRDRSETSCISDKRAEQSVNSNNSVNSDQPSYNRFCLGVEAQETFAASTPHNISIPLCIFTSENLIDKSHNTFEDIENNVGELFSANDLINKTKPTVSDFWTQESPSCIISTMNAEFLSNTGDSFENVNTFDSLSKCYNKCPKPVKNMRHLAQNATNDYIQQKNKQIARDTIVTRNKLSSSQSLFENNCVTMLPTKKTSEVVTNEQYKLFSPISQSTEASLLCLNSNFNDESFTSMSGQSNKLYNPFLTDHSLNCFTQANIYEVNDDTALWEQSSSRNFQGDRTEYPSSDIYRSHDDRIELEVQIDEPDDPEIQLNTTINNLVYDSAYSTLGNANKHLSDSSDTVRVITRSYKKKIMYEKKNTSLDFSLMPQDAKVRRKGQQSATEKRKSECAKDPSEKEKKYKKGRISTKWLSFTLQSSNVEYIILKSIKVILSALNNNGIVKEYAISRRWKDTLSQEAVSAILDISDIFRTEGKPDICREEIVTAIMKTLKKITSCAQLNKTSVWIYHIQIILELCNSLSVSITVIDYLMETLKSLQSALFCEVTRIQWNATISLLHLVFYFLNNALQKYRAIVPSDRKFNFAGAEIPHFTEVWKTRYINQELEEAGLNLDATEKRWCNMLEDFTIASMKCNYVQFAKKSLLLSRLLIE